MDQFLFHSKWKNTDDLFVPWNDTSTFETLFKTAWDIFNDKGEALNCWVLSLTPNKMPHEPHDWGYGPMPRIIQDK